MAVEKGKIIGPTPKEISDANSGELAPVGITKKLINLSKKWQFRLGLAGIVTAGLS